MHTPPPRPAPLRNNTRLLPKTSGPHEYSRRWRHNRIRWDQRREIPIVRGNASAPVLYSMHASRWRWCCSPVPCLTLTYHPPTHVQMLKHLHTHTHWHPPTCFYVYTVWLVNTGSCVLTFSFLFFFLVRKVICSASSRNRSASARRLMTQSWSWIICE